ncbi:MAG: hypothetical protein ACRDO8_12175, partial [Nocardioidaceae bacterium]
VGDVRRLVGLPDADAGAPTIATRAAARAVASAIRESGAAGGGSQRSRLLPEAGPGDLLAELSRRLRPRRR